MATCCNSNNAQKPGSASCCSSSDNAQKPAQALASCCSSSDNAQKPAQASASCCGSSGNVQKPSACCSGKVKLSHSGDVHDSVKHYYGKELKNSDDNQTGVNCVLDATMPLYIREAVGEVHDDVTAKYYGCGLCIPEAVEGCSVLDLGSGSGRDCFALSKLVGPSGQVVGVDMTEEQLAVAREHIDYHRERFGYSKSNVEFRFGYIENLAAAGLQDNTFDIIVSNCVVNLSPDKRSVLREAHRVLKEGGELYFSDVYADRHVSDDIRNHRVLWGECISGALYWPDLVDIAQEVGFGQPRLVTAKMVDTSQFTAILGDAKFVSVTYRLFKLLAREDEAATARQVTYKGGIPHYPEELKFDHAVTFKKGVSVAVDAELSTELASSRFAAFFTFGDRVSDPDTSNPIVDPFTLAKPAGPRGADCCPGIKPDNVKLSN